MSLVKESPVVDSNVLGLRCRECAREYPVSPIYTCEWCFGPLEVAYDYDAIARSISREKIAAGPASLWRYSDLLPVALRPVGRSRHRLHAARARRPARRRARPRRGVDQERHAQPHELVQGPGRLDRAEQGARVRLQGRRVRVHRQPRQLGRGARGARRSAQLRVHPVEPRAGQDRHHVGLRRQRRRDRRQLRRREPSVRRARRHLRLGVREREHAAVLRRGFENARVRDGRAARLAHARSRRRTGRERLAAHQDPEGLQELHRVGLLDDEPHVRVSGAQALGCSPIATAFIEKSDTIRPVKPDTIAKSLAIGNPADGYFALDAVRNSDGGFAAVTDGEIVEGMELLARTEGIFAETAGGVTIATLAAARGRRHRARRRARRRLHHRSRPEDDRGRRSYQRPDRHHRTESRRVPRRVRHRGGLTAMAVTIRIPTQLRSLAGGAVGSLGRGRDRRRRVEGARRAARGLRRAPLRRQGRAAPLRQRVRRRRGHPLHAGRRHARSPTARSSASSPPSPAGSGRLSDDRDRTADAAAVS